MDSQFFSSISSLILDMDGVLWRGAQPLGDLPAIFRGFEQAGLGVVLATNNATLSAEQYRQKLAGFGVDLDTRWIVNSSQATGRFLQKRFPDGGPVYIVGEAGLVTTLAAYNFHSAGDAAEDSTSEDVLAVIVGLDRDLTYAKVDTASRLVRQGALFVGTNPDVTYPLPDRLAPGAGAVIAAVAAAAGVEPLIVGKPAPEIYRLALERLQPVPSTTGDPSLETPIDPAAVLVIGDRLDTDIAGAQALGCRSVLVLSGISTAEEAARWLPAPDWIAPDLTAVLEKLIEARR